MIRLSRLAGTLALAVVLIAPVCEAKYNPLHSIRPLQILKNGTLATVCTAWATRSGEITGFVSAFHCIASEEGEPLLDADWYIDGKRAEMVAWDGAKDLVFFKGGPAGAHPLPISFIDPEPRDPIWAAGYPMGSKVLHAVQGIFSASKDDGNLNAVNLGTAPGMSGSPVFSGDMVVGVLVRTECPSPWPTWCVEGQSISVKDLREFLRL